MPVFIIGTKERFSVGTAVEIAPEGIAHESFTRRTRKIPPYFRLRNARGSFENQGAKIVRGVADEGGGYYARVLPPDAEAGLADLDRQIEEAHARVKALYEERLEYIAANVVRGERIAKKHVAPPAKGG